MLKILNYVLLILLYMLIVIEHFVLKEASLVEYTLGTMMLILGGMIAVETKD